MGDKFLSMFRAIIPAGIFHGLQPVYHMGLSFIGALIYRFPSRKLKIIAVTGTKGKSSTVEILNAILEEAGLRTALSNTIRFKIAEKSERNLYKMSMPGRLFMHRFLRRAVNAGCQHAIVEMTSQGSLLFRHKFIDIDTLIFTNLSPEHIEAHGSYEKYAMSKVAICKEMEGSKKKTTLIANGDDRESARFLSCHVNEKIKYTFDDALPYRIDESGIELTLSGIKVRSKLQGLFNLYNILAAATCAKNEGVPVEIIARAIEGFSEIPGRVEKISAGQDFTVVVDYAHTPDSLEKLYKVFRPEPGVSRPNGQRLIAVLGGTGGGRDNWKRKEMGHLADMYCDEIILTDEDPYDEDPSAIIADVAKGIVGKRPLIILDRREAIRAAVNSAKTGDVVLVTGKGTDPYIMGPCGTKTPWSDEQVAREEILALKRAL